MMRWFRHKSVQKKRRRVADICSHSNGCRRRSLLHSSMVCYMWWIFYIRIEVKTLNLTNVFLILYFCRICTINLNSMDTHIVTQTNYLKTNYLQRTYQLQNEYHYNQIQTLFKYRASATKCPPLLQLQPNFFHLPKITTHICVATLEPIHLYRFTWYDRQCYLNCTATHSRFDSMQN